MNLRLSPVPFVLLLATVSVLGLVGRERAESQEATTAAQVTRPVYADNGHLRLPPNYREWIFVGSSLGMSYTEGTAMGHEMFHEILMEPGAYRHFVETGEFAEGTQLALILHATGESVLPMRRGRFAAEIHGVEMAIKDSSRFEEGWAYFGFGGMGGIRETAEAFPADSCHDCHAAHAALDNVFAQFYPMLTEAAGVEVALRYVGDESDTGAGELSGPAGTMMGGQPAAEESYEASPETDAGAEADESAAERVVAYGGLDPIMLVAGREEMGKAEIVEDFEGWRYQFASEPNRATFAADPERYAPQNEGCLMMGGEGPASPGLFAVHEGRIYVFGSVNCREEFKSDPEAVLPAAAGTAQSAAFLRQPR